MPKWTSFRIPATLLAYAALASIAFGNPTLTVTDQKGRSIEIELVSVSADSVTFRRAGSSQQYKLPLNQFDTASQSSIRSQASQLPVAVPKIEPNIIIGKRRRKDDSWYLVKQEISCTVKLTNSSSTESVSALSGKIIFFGQDQRTPEIFGVLSTQSFEVSMAPGETFSREMDGFVTSYDSDNKGTGNVGGLQYYGYLLVLQDAAGNIVLDQTTTGSIRQILDNKPSLLKEILKYSKNQYLNSKLEPAAGH